MLLRLHGTLHCKIRQHLTEIACRTYPYTGFLCQSTPAPLLFFPPPFLYKIDLGEAPFSPQTMCNETHKKAVWKDATKERGAGERG